MKTLILVMTILTSNICKADLAAQLAAALNQSAEDKKATTQNLQVDDGSIKASFSRGGVSTIKDAETVAQIEQAPSQLSADSEEVEVQDGLQETIAAEIQEARAVALQKNGK